MISELNENKLIKTKIHLKKILEEGFKIIEENKSVFNIYHSLFRRYIYSLESVNLLLDNFNADRKYRELSISIILRASLLDYLTTLYLRTYHAEKNLNPNLKSKYDTEIEKLMSEQIRRILTVPEIDKKSSFYNHDDFCKTVDNVRANYSNLFDSSIEIDYNKPSKSLRYKAQDDITPAIIRKRLDSLADRFQGINYLDVFYLYDIYSKYDHFGTMSMLLEHMDINDICHNVLGAIFHIGDGIGFCMDILVDEVGCKSDFEKINSEICYLRGVIHTKTLWLSPEYKAKHK